MSSEPALLKHVKRRRTFAIISHPDAGKTTLTERLLHLGGAIQMAGHVRAKGERRRTRSDWLSIEQQRGISVGTSVLTFEYNDCVFNLLDTPGHEDFSEDTYRTLTVVDCAIMVLDAAKGIEDRTRKLFEICRMRDIPIITFINKMDREAQDCFDLLEEVGDNLALDVSPINWPVGRARDFVGVYEIGAKNFALKEPLDDNDPRLAEAKEEGDLAQGASPAYNEQSFNEGHLTPVFFGSAMKGIGVKELLEGLITYAPYPRAQKACEREVVPTEEKLSALVFRIQANMDPQHRDRMAFARICSGKLTRGMRLHHGRTGKSFGLNAPQFFFAQDRQIVEEAYAGDVIGIPNHGMLRIGDTLTEGENIHFTGVPNFAPEILRRVHLSDAMRAKQLRQGLTELAEEGVTQLFRPVDGSPPLVGVVGSLQLDVLQARMKGEYKVDIQFDVVNYAKVAWVEGEKKDLENFIASNRSNIAEDLEGHPVFLASSAFVLQHTADNNPSIKFMDIRQIGTQTA